MTPAVDQLKHHDVAFRLHDYVHDPSSPAYGAEAAQKLGVSEERVFKTLVVALSDKSLAVGVLPVATQLNLKAMAKASGSKKATMADPALVQRVTGYVLGGVSPFGQKKPLPTILADRSANFETIFVSGGRRGLEIEVAPEDLLRVLNGRCAPIT